MRYLTAALCVWTLSAAAAWAAPTSESGGTSKPNHDLNLPVEGVISNPDWLRTPNGEDFATYYPRLASMMGLGGRAVVHCAVAADGGLDHCEITSETPKGMGFGEAAIQMAGVFRMKPRTIDGQPVAGGTITIPIRFQPPAADTSSAALAPPSPGDPARLALAHRLAAAVHWDIATANAAKTFQSQLLSQQQSQALTTEESLAVSAINAAGTDYANSILARREAKLADVFSAAQLAKLIQIFESPEAQAWFAHLDEFQQDDGSPSDTWATLMAGARVKFCQQVACIAEAAPAATPLAPK